MRQKRKRRKIVLELTSLDYHHSPLVITKTGLLGAEIAKQYKYKAFGDVKYESGTYNDNHKFIGKELLDKWGALQHHKITNQFLVVTSFIIILSVLISRKLKARSRK